MKNFCRPGWEVTKKKKSMAERSTRIETARLFLRRQGTEDFANSKVENVIKEATEMADVVSVIRVGSGILQNMIQMYPYRTMNRELMELCQALLQLDLKVDEFERSDLDFETRAAILGRIRVLACETYSEVEREWAAKHALTGSDEFLDLYFDSYDNPQRWKANTAMVCRVLKDLTSFSQSVGGANVEGVSGVLVAGLYGLTTLGMVIGKDCDRELRKGRSVNFPITYAPNPVCPGTNHTGLVYRVESWTVDAEGNCGRLRKRKLSARVECRQDEKDDVPQISKIYHITRETRPRKAGRYPKERYAFVTTSSGILQAQVRSVLPKDPPVGCWGEPLVGAGTLLERGHTDYDIDDDYVSQDYVVDIMLAKTAIEGLGGEKCIRQLRVEGEKQFRETYYVCFVEAHRKREILAIYRHNLKHGMSLTTSRKCRQEVASDGLFHFLGVANHPLLRDLILCSFVAMGLTSEL
ncbi:hypothetical protein R1flu_018015 [Riccia fluitans]|uniref:Uncharacterized protein n=1 Tax=Riccia fluitans TaxID=41844 RepID=A0ABD1ZEU6_9MARC